MTPAALKAARKSLGLSAEAFARRVGVSGSRTVYKWEHGEAPIPGPLAALLDIVERSPEARALLVSAAPGSGRSIC